MTLRSLLGLVAACSLVPSTLGQQVVFEVSGSETEGFGRCVARLDDLDGDGVDDWATGLPFQDGLTSDSGAVEIRSGADGSLIETLTWDLVHHQFGRSVANAGDVDGDGTEDIVVGAPGNGVNGIVSGTVLVYSGADFSLLKQLDGPPDANFGYAVASAGDLDQDGKAELLVGGPGDDQAGNDAGRLFLFRGSDDFLLRELAGPPGRNFGTVIQPIGDVTGDGKGDLLVGAGFPGGNFLPFAWVVDVPGFTQVRQHLPNVGSTNTTFGAALAALGDVDGDLVPDYAVSDPTWEEVHVYSGADGAWIRTHTGDANSQFGRSLCGIGDLDGDGFGELLVGAPSQDDPTDPTEEVGAAIAFSGATGQELLRAHGTHLDDGFAVALAAADDPAGSGVPCVLVGSFGGAWVHLVRLTPDAYFHCVGAPNSVGPGATLDVLGSASVSTADLVLRALGCPPGQFGLFFFGPDEVAPVPMGDGVRCTGGLLRRLPVMNASAAGILVTAPLAFPEGQADLLPGTTWSFQCWYRDPFGPGGTTYNVSNAYRVTFYP